MKEGPEFRLLIGFLDYHFAFPIVRVLWTIIGTIFFLINFGSYIPEIMLMIRNKSNEGISMLFCICNSTNQALLLLNVISLNFAEGIGIFQYPITYTFAALITFLTLFFQWLLFLPVVYLNFIYNDQSSMKNETKEAKRHQWRMVCIYLIINAVLFSLFLIIWLTMGCQKGFMSHIVRTMGSMAGIISATIEVLQFIPQFITTFKLRDSGSLSLAMLSVQGPSLVCSSLFMWLALGEEWTTYVCVMIDGLALISLLVICLLFKLWKMIKSNKVPLDALSAIILEPIIPVDEGDNSILH